MNIKFNTHNTLQLQGRIASVKEYSAGKAARISLAIDNGKDKNGNQRDTQYLQLKNFSPSCYNMIRKGMKVQIYGHVQPNVYEKDGTTIYDTDLVADYVEFLEPRTVAEEREQRKMQAA